MEQEPRKHPIRVDIRALVVILNTCAFFRHELGSAIDIFVSVSVQKRAIAPQKSESKVHNFDFTTFSVDKDVFRAKMPMAIFFTQLEHERHDSADLNQNTEFVL